MEREKIIEEMAKKVCIACGKCKELKGDCYLARNIASVMIDDGYRKIPDGAVVLTKEEMETTDKIPQKIKDFYKWFIEIEKEQVRKETAREILKKLKMMIKEPWQAYELSFDDLHRIAEKYGVEVEE